LTVENPHYKASMVLCIPKGGNIKSFFLLEEKTLHGRKDVREGRLFCTWSNIIIFLCEGSLNSLVVLVIQPFV
jgi:hypothetical protein